MTKALISCKGTDGNWVEWGEFETGLSAGMHYNTITAVPVQERICISVKVKPSGWNLEPAGRIGFTGRVPETASKQVFNSEELIGTWVKSNGHQLKIESRGDGIVMFNGGIGGNFKGAEPIELIMIDDNACATSVGWPFSPSIFKIRDGKNIEIHISSGHEIVFTKLVSEA